MSEVSQVALLRDLLESSIASIADLYDRMANAIDPYGPDAEEAERLFTIEFNRLWDSFVGERNQWSVSVDPDTFRRELVKKCRDYLKANRVRIIPRI